MRRKPDNTSRESEQRFRTIFEEGPIGIALIGPDGRLVKGNRALCQMLEYSEPELGALDFTSLTHPEDRAGTLQFIEELFAGGTAPHSLDRRFLTKNRQLVWGNLIASLVRDPEGNPLYALAMIENITERKEAEAITHAALREKEVLMREVHHRVKNNLQVISSLLRLEAGYTTDNQALEMLRQSQNRVRSMALVHEHLHRSPDLSKIHFGEYVKCLAASLFCSYGVDSGVVRLRVEIEDTLVGIDTAIPCGLIIHELVANSLKHAFPNGRKGEVQISFRSLTAGKHALTVADDGVGLPQATGAGDRGSLGLRLVEILTDQLEGKVERATGNGTRFRITFRERNRKEEIQS